MELVYGNPRDCLRRVVDFRKSAFREIEERFPEKTWLKTSLRKIKKVVFINSSSRSGSSLLFSTLRKIPGIYSLSGESVPFYKLNNLSFGRFASDEIPQDTAVNPGIFSDLSRDFISDLSVAGGENNIFKDSLLAEEYIEDIVLRLPMQWPQICFSYDSLKDLVTEAFASYRDTGKDFCKEEFYLELLSSLMQKYKIINPYYYDLPVRMIKSRFPELEISSGPPNNMLTIEEPPFIMLSPRAKATEADILGNTLLLKTSIDSYRMEFLASFFPEAQIKTIQLVRNPLGCINGLCDGWLHRGFFSHKLQSFIPTAGNSVKMLKISGYSELSEWGKWWWNYDLPAGWQDYIDKPLEEVCAFQWYSSNKAIQEYLAIRGENRCLIRYEDLIKGLGARIQEIERIMDFMGVSRQCIGQLGLENLPVVQATEEPRPFRWKNRQEKLLPLLQMSQIREMCLQLGYDKDNFGEWF
ncbi:MAG: hypothetical protein PHC71_02260 [Candidatus Omnitrophica bacterium]|nr:hypothetical protein [Candidatus Omnitrophota bacterium]